ncbi:MAG: hypothetical protein ACJ76N_01180 [Thermoanaerobaculia bacterium]
MLKRLILGGLTAWAACAFLAELNHLAADWDDRKNLAGVWGWRFETPETEALGRSLDMARRAIPPGSVVAFATPSDLPEVQFREWRWTAYLLPDCEVLPVSDPAVGGLAQYAIAYRTEIHHPRAETVLRLPDGWLYRVKRP